MSLSTTESPITRVIFAQKIFRFAGRTPKDLAIVNFVCKDFQETMQAHHTFNLVLYDNIIKKRKDEVTFEEDEHGNSPTRVTFFDLSVTFLETAPAWIVYQWTTVNEHDETQRELLKAFLLFQAENGNRVLIRQNVSGEDSSTTRELLLHIIDSCVKLGIAKEVLEASGNCWTCVMHAVSRKISAESLALLIESCAQHGLDVKKILEQNDTNYWNCIMIAVQWQLSAASFKLLIESCVQHGVDMKRILERQNADECTCLSIMARLELPVDSFRVLIAQFPSNDSFRATLAARNRWEPKGAVEYARTEEIKAFLEDPDCWKKCREWCTSKGIVITDVSAAAVSQRFCCCACW